MSAAPTEVTLGLTPRARLAADGERVLAYPRCLYCSFHTTAGYLEQSLAARLSRRRRAVARYVGMFRTLFPEGAGYRHDQLDDRSELSGSEREIEPLNGDSHLAYIAAGLRTCVSYVNARPGPVCFVDLDGVYAGQARRRVTTVIGYSAEVEVVRARLEVPVSSHPVDSVNLKDARLGIYEQIADLIASHDVSKGRIRFALGPGERHVGMTVNEYETLLMRHDLPEVLRNPLRFMAEKGRHMMADPRAIPVKTLGYAKYDLVRTFNQFVDALGLEQSLVERVLSRAIAVPAARFLRMKRSVSLLISDGEREGRGAIAEGRYQSPILVQWRGTDRRARVLDLILSRFV